MRKVVLGIAAAVSLLAAPVFAHQANPEEPTDTIADIVVASATGEQPEFATLLAAVQAADPAVLEALSDPEATLTVFAPTDAAFAALAEELGEEVFGEVLADPETLTAILLYHVVGQPLDSTAVVGALDALGANREAWGIAPDAAATIETLNGQSLDIAYTEEGGITIDTANLVLEMVDIKAANGVIHVIDAVLLPETRTLAEILVEVAGAESPVMATLLTAVTAADPVVLETASDPEAQLTIFAPTDAAFAALSEALGADGLAAIVADPAQLTPILAYHVAEGVTTSSDLGAAFTESMGEAILIPTLNGAELSFTLDMENGLLLNDNVRIILTDIDAVNGVVHIIDAVLVPPTE